MKTCRLKVFPNQEVKISVPLNVTEDWISNYLSDKSVWIDQKLTLFQKTKGYSATNFVKDGMSISILGQSLIFSVKYSIKEYIYQENNILYIGVSDIKNYERNLKVFEKWWKLESLNIFNKYLDKLFPIIGKYHVKKPKIQIRKMKTLWGSCSPHRSIITLNFYLMKAKPACIEYVVLHELIHLLYPNHSKDFYDFLSIAMPDWKDRKHILDHDAVQGL
ncbi:M48 family metallopeptidase [Clostridium botulinum]|nr:M48 family metallopeptidase [Clostridium botulinum]MCS4479557.1 M48 family metallopeptidase [Clostridium botulinum]MCS4483831.1 M48 family metallopeptidase [Clostridium botulinum]